MEASVLGVTPGSSPAFTIVMPAHDNASTIGEAIESVLRQTRSDWELIVVDDGSSDGTADVAESVADPRVCVVREQTNRGPAAARNRGISLAQAPLICTLDSDDLWLPQYLETMASALEANPDVSVAFTDAWVLNETTRRVRKKSAMAFQDPPESVPEDAEAFLVELLRRNFIYNSVAARCEALRSVGGYDERLWVGEDWELWLRLAAAGFRFIRIPQLLAVYRQRTDSLMSDAERRAASRQEVYRIVAEEWTADPELRELALRLQRARALRNRRRATAGVVLWPLFALRSALRDSMHWHDEPPREVADLLLTLGETRQA